MAAPPLNDPQRAAVEHVDGPLLIFAGAGCHAPGQGILMADGSVRKVEAVRCGDWVMGWDGTARRVLRTTRGSGQMFRVVPVKGEAFDVNEDHVLTLVESVGGIVFDVTVRDWFLMVRKRRKQSKLFRGGVEAFSLAKPDERNVDPYFLGVLLGDGSMGAGVQVCKPDLEIRQEVAKQAKKYNLEVKESTHKVASSRTYGLSYTGPKLGRYAHPNQLINELRTLGLYQLPSEERFVPVAYLRGPRDVRLDVLAGLLDTDGYLGRNTYDFINKSKQLALDVVFLARSCGLASYIKPSEKYDQHGHGGIYWRVSISGDVDVVPCRIERKKASPRKQIKDACRTGIVEIKPLGLGEFFGFTIDGDGRYLLDDFTVTHNSGKTRVLTHRAAALINQGVKPGQILLVTFTKKAAGEMRDRMIAMVGKQAKGLVAGTFHSVCAGGLRKRADLIQRTATFEIYTGDEQETVLKQVVEELRLDKKRYVAKELVEKIATCKQKALLPADVELEDDEAKIFQDIWFEYEAWLRYGNALDFEDLIVNMMRLAEREDEVGVSLRERFQHVMVDEFQDTNLTQYRLVRAFGANRNLCVVGDDDQCQPPGTRVWVEGGMIVPIETLKNGDYVVGWDRELHTTSMLRKVRVAERSYEGAMIRIVLDGWWMALEVTPNHVLFVKSYGAMSRQDEARRMSARELVDAFTNWVPPYRNLKLPVPTIEGIQWMDVLTVEMRAYKGPVYSLDVEHDHAYIANGIGVGNSIYQWRGADRSIILGFKKDFPDAKIVKLEQNYRSTKNIVSAALGVISKGENREPKELWTANPEGPRVALVECPDDRDEGVFVAGRAKKLVGAGVEASEIAVLYRSHSLSRPVEDELRLGGVPYTVIGGHSFYERKEVKDVLAYLRLAKNSDSDVDLMRVANRPVRGIGPGTLKKLREIAKRKKTSMFGAIEFAHWSPDIRLKEREQLGKLRELVGMLGAKTMTMRPSDAAALILEVTRYKKMWEDEALDAKTASAREDADERAKNCDQVVESIAYYEKRTLDEGETPTVLGYLQDVALLTDHDSADATAKVSLMSVHAAKGLEFDFVFVIGFEAKIFPHENAMTPVEIGEERRLAYVAITRARRQLWITHCASRLRYGRIIDGTPSMFVEDLPEGSVVALTQFDYEKKERAAILKLNVRADPALPL